MGWEGSEIGDGGCVIKDKEIGSEKASKCGIACVPWEAIEVKHLGRVAPRNSSGI